MHYYDTRLNNVNVPFNNTNFGNQRLIIKDTFLIRKYNILVFSFVNFNEYTNYVINVLS